MLPAGRGADPGAAQQLGSLLPDTSFYLLTMVLRALLGSALLFEASGSDDVDGGRSVSASGAPPTVGGLLVDLKPEPALGVSTRPSFSWIVPSSPALAAGQVQTSYRVLVSGSADFAEAAWDSGAVSGAQQSHVQSGAELTAATKYHWKVELRVQDSHGKTLSVSSHVATFVTALTDWDPRTRPIWAAAGDAERADALPRGRFIKPHTDYPAPIAGYPGGSMFYQRYNDSTLHFVTNCPEHPEWCGPAQAGCYQHLHQWLGESVTVSDAYFSKLHFRQGDNFTCSQAPAGQVSPPGLKSFAMARTEIRGLASARQAIVFVTAAEVHTGASGVDGDMPGQDADVHARRLLAQYKLFVAGRLIGVGPGRGDDNTVSAPSTLAGLL